MSTLSYLAKFNVTFEQASQYVHANMHDLPGIVAVARQYGITSDMLGELAGGYSGAQVRGYLAGFGIAQVGGGEDAFENCNMSDGKRDSASSDPVSYRPALPAFSDSMIGQVAVASAFALVGIASQHAHSLFDELLSGFVL